MCDCPTCSRGGYTYSEEWRHITETRFVVALPDDEARASYLAGVREKRGELAYKRLRNDAWELLRVNRGR